MVAVVSYFREHSEHPRSGPAGRRDDTYWTCIAANAATMRHVADTPLEFVVCAGSGPPAWLRPVLDDAGVTVRVVPFDHRPPEGFYDRYLGSLYLLDALQDAAGWVGPDDVVMFIDPDVVWGAPYGPLVEEIEAGGIVAYELVVDEDLPMCDLSRRDQAAILQELTGTDLDGTVPRHFGGEFYGMLGSEVPAFAAAVESMWKEMLRRHAAGRAHHNSEEHVINAVLWQRRERSSRAHPHLQRIRTLPGVWGTRERMHDDLIAWHLPIEKEIGFPNLVAHLAAEKPLPPPGPTYHRWLRRMMGVQPAGARRAADVLRQVKWRVTGQVRPDTTHSGL
ncbi:MAG: hypothetical protein ACSLFP_00545 [Acidimicrobiales bacterium]